MVVITEIRRRGRFIVGPILGISLVCYFAYHLVQGDRGLIAWLRLSQEIKQAQTSLDAVEAQRQPLAQRVAMMRPNSIDRDLLDERARATLNLTAPDEITIFNRSAP